MYDQIIQIGLIKIGVAIVIGLLVGIYEAANKTIGNGWTPIIKQPLHERIWNRLRGRGSTSVEIRQEHVRVHKKAR